MSFTYEILCYIILHILYMPYSYIMNRILSKKYEKFNEACRKVLSKFLNHTRQI